MHTSLNLQKVEIYINALVFVLHDFNASSANYCRLEYHQNIQHKRHSLYLPELY